MLRNLKRVLFGILLMIPAIYSDAQKTDPTLKIGDKAPELRVEWVKGTPVKDFEQDKLYVLEFWATWCGPCKAAMPHLSELAKEYNGKVVFIGVNIWEKLKDGQPYESVYPDVKAFVEKMGDKMAYNVAADKNDLFMSTSWMKASGENGIPASFLIKEGRIIWIGHPVKLDTTLMDVFAGKYDMNAYAREMEEQKVKNDKIMAPLYALGAVYKEAIAARDYLKALDEIEKARPSIDSMFLSQLDYMKFRTYLQFDVPAALTFAKEWTAKSPDSKATVAETIAMAQNLGKDAYQLAVSYLQEYLNNKNIPAPYVYELISLSYYNSGDLKNAISNLELAISTAEEILKAGTDESIDSEMITGYRTTLETYRKSLN